MPPGIMFAFHPIFFPFSLRTQIDFIHLQARRPVSLNPPPLNRRRSITTRRNQRYLLRPDAAGPQFQRRALLLTNSSKHQSRFGNIICQSSSPVPENIFYLMQFVQSEMRR